MWRCDRIFEGQRGPDFTLLMGSEIRQPLQDVCILSPARESARMAAQRSGASNCLALHLEIYGRVAIRRVDAGVPEPMADRRRIHPGLEEMDRRAMAHAVRMKSFPRQGRSDRLRILEVLGQDVPDAEAG